MSTLKAAMSSLMKSASSKHAHSLRSDISEFSYYRCHCRSKSCKCKSSEAVEELDEVETVKIEEPYDDSSSETDDAMRTLEIIVAKCCCINCPLKNLCEFSFVFYY